MEASCKAAARWAGVLRADGGDALGDARARGESWFLAPRAVPFVSVAFSPEHEKWSLPNLYFLGTYFKNNTVMDFTIQK